MHTYRQDVCLVVQTSRDYDTNCSIKAESTTF